MLEHLAASESLIRGFGVRGRRFDSRLRRSLNDRGGV
jgi:hypothetical protein